MLIKPMATKKRRSVGIIERPIKATMSFVRSRDPITLLLVSKKSLTKFLSIRKMRRTRRIILRFISP